MNGLLNDLRLVGAGAGLEIDEERKEWYERIKDIQGDAKGVFEKGVGIGGRGASDRDRFKVTYRKPKRARDHRICDFGRSIGCHRDTCDNHIQAEDRGALERDHDGDPRSLKAFLQRGRKADAWFKRALAGKAEEGQSTVEYALISVALLSIVLGIGMLGDLLTNGAFVSHALNAASHGVQNAFGGAMDVFSF